VWTGWIGKLAGAALGYAIARLPGALVGVLAGHQFDRGMGGGRTRRSGASEERQRVFFESTFLVMGHLAKCDGRVSETEIGAARAVMARMRLDGGQTRLAMELFSAGKQPDFSLEPQIDRLARYCERHPQLLRAFLEIQLDLTLAKGAISTAERSLLERIADRIGVSRLALSHLEALMRARRSHAAPDTRRSSAGALEEAYDVLGVDRTASDRDVKTAYRRLMNEHHPDKQASRGLPESMLELAKERTAEVRAAWETVKAARGLR
jgi:DnaJ like chaperone protein